ncbi:MAG: N-acetylmuramoyl-L-alanine amidase [Verrucomicrobiota bacterium]|nr:N-acetylmuramoyl-L-alanine amidase [Verrucomicrobiota bacterium]
MARKTITRLALALAVMAAGAAMRAAASAGRADYLDVAAFGGRFGLSAHWRDPEKRLVLQSATARIEFEADLRDAVFDGRKIYLGSPAVYRRGSLWISAIDAEKVLTPLLRLGRDRPPPVRTIVIDPGHGGSDHGTENKRLGLMEKTFTLDTALRLQRLLENRGYKAVLTRTEDVYVPLALRPEVARRTGADLFISIHFNGHVVSAVHGTETFRFTPRYQTPIRRSFHRAEDDEPNPGNKNDYWNTVLGYCIHRALLGKLGSLDRGLRHDELAVLRLAPCPAILVESGYLSNDAEGRKIATPAYRQEIAEAIAVGIDAYAHLGRPAAPAAPPRRPAAPSPAGPVKK